ncbi:MAG: nucleoside phosphorylase [Candidatus Thorarchaeota archaeon]|jgi:uridine phosphorylase
MTDDREYHIGIAPGEIPELVLLPGDPDRARDIALKFFDEPEEIAQKREYLSFKGKWKGVPVAVCSTGIGCPSAAIAMEELVKVGCTVFLRVGTAGAISRSVATGDLVIFAGSVRDDGTSRQYVPIQFPAVADPEIVVALTKSAQIRGVKYHVGIGHSKDAFYSEHPDYVADPEGTRRKWDMMRDSGVLATEMEAAALFVIGHLRGVKVGTVCVVIGENVEKEVKIVGKPPIDDLISVALDAITSFKR